MGGVGNFLSSRRAGQNSMKIRFSTQQAGCFPSRDRAGMTLIEVMIALAITGLMVGGIITGYIYCTTAAIKAELAQLANAKALQRVEEARSAPWNTSSVLTTDQLIGSNFPVQTVSLDMPGTDTNGTLATIYTTIAPISPTPFSPPIATIHVDCVWQFRGAEWVTNSIETIRAADQ
jgi:prepilin-type N-terminal cleavage/methylation domain-containing protein